jgi:hypothetical protein
MTSLFRELVSVPTEPCFSINTVEAPSRAWSFLAIAKPTTPPPMTACVKSASLLMVDEKDLDCRVRGIMREIARDVNMMKERTALVEEKA